MNPGRSSTGSARPPAVAFPCSVAFRRPLLAHLVGYSMEWSDDLAPWSTVSVETSVPEIDPDSTGMVQVRIPFPETARTRFIRSVVAHRSP